MLANVRAIEIIIGDDAKPTVTMLYYTDNEKIEEMPTEGSPGQIHTTDDRQREFSATVESPICVAVALPLGYTPNIGGQKIKQLGKIVYKDKVYVWWTTDSYRFEQNFTVSY